VRSVGRRPQKAFAYSAERTLLIGETKGVLQVPPTKNEAWLGPMLVPWSLAGVATWVGSMTPPDSANPRPA